VRPTPQDTAAGVEVRARVCAHVLDMELSEPIEGLERTTPDGRWANRAWALVRLCGEPLGLDVLEIPPGGLSGEAILALELDRWMPRLSQILGVDGTVLDREQVCTALPAVKGTTFTVAHQEFIDRAPRCSVVVCTRDRPADLRRCLNSLAIQDHPDYAVWVVDNAPTSEGTRQIVDELSDDMDIHYIVEPCPGLSRARNAALRDGLHGDWVAWLDDDEVADPMWLTELMRAFDGRPDVVAASGVVVPAQLDTEAQIWFEQFGGHSKGRGFTADLFSRATRSRQHPLYPLPPFGVGANMAFRTETLRMLGGFDEALGAGTPCQGSEDTRMFTDVLVKGGAIAYWPSAVTRHFHRRDMVGLRRQMRGYGSGLTAFYTASVLARPSAAASLVCLAPRALRDVISSGSLRVATLEDDFPRDLLAENRRGMVAGPWLYLRGKMQVWRAGR
jgi:glycosyltransferase involved in cell wall biosynthesis